MKSLLLGLTVVGLLGAMGCNRGTPGGLGATAPATTTDGATSTVVNKPMMGEADNSFSLKLPMRAVTIKQGEEKSVVIGISRGRNFGEEVALQLADLPIGLTLAPEALAIARDDKEATLVFKAADDAALGAFTVKLTGHAANGGIDSMNELKLTVAQK